MAKARVKELCCCAVAAAFVTCWAPECITLCSPRIAGHVTCQRIHLHAAESDSFEDDLVFVDAPWFDAARYGDIDAAKELLLDGSVTDVNAADDDFDPLNGRGRTALHEAARAGQADMVIWLLEHGAYVQEAEYWCGYTALHEAVLSGSLATVNALLSFGAEVGPKCYGEKATPLHYAARAGDAELCRLLLSAGADPDSEDGQERMAADCARENGHADVYRDLAAYFSRGAGPKDTN
eukprot:4774137-Amphidinium_carterae.1